MPAEFFDWKARQIIAAAHGDPDTAGPLATWAEDVKTRRWDEAAGLGVLVAADGRLVAETRRGKPLPDRPNPAYVTRILDPAVTGIERMVSDMAAADAHYQLGLPVILVAADQVCQGAGPRRPAMSPAQFAGYRSLLGLTHDEMGARLVNRFGRPVNPATIRDWETGREQIGQSIAGQVRKLAGEHDALVREMLTADEPIRLSRRGEGGGWQIAAYGRALTENPDLPAVWDAAGAR